MKRAMNGENFVWWSNDMRRAALSCVWIVSSLGCGSSGTGTNAANPRSESVVGQAVPDLALRPIGGGEAFRLSELHGKIVLLDVWASWCAPCKEELPMLDDMAEPLRARGVEIVAVSIDESKADAELFLRSRPHWTIRLAHDPDGKVPDRLKPAKMPSSYVVDRQGVIRQVNAGFERADVPRIENRLLELAAAP
jgi:thiol-disulfide isomerase/thioredoxin